MNERIQNIAIGITIIVALCLLGGLIVIFSGNPTLLHRGYKIEINMPTTADVQVGGAVHVAGLNVGKVIKTEFSDPNDVSKGVNITIEVTYGTTLPANTVAKIYKKSFVGSAYIQLESEGDIPIDPETGKVLTISKEQMPTIPGNVVTPTLLPKEMQESLKNISDLARTLNTLLGGKQTIDDDKTTTIPDEEPVNLRKAFENLDKTLAGLAEIFGDPQNIENLNKSITNIAEVTEQAKNAVKEIRNFAKEAGKTANSFSKAIENTSVKADSLIMKLLEDAEEASKLIATVNRVAEQFETQKGSAGKFINDPELYNNLVTATKQLTILLEQIQNLAKKWKEQGIKLNM